MQESESSKTENEYHSRLMRYKNESLKYGFQMFLVLLVIFILLEMLTGHWEDPDMFKFEGYGFIASVFGFYKHNSSKLKKKYNIE